MTEEHKPYEKYSCCNQDTDRRRIVKDFMALAFPQDEEGSPYFEEWVGRFSSGLPERMMDNRLRAIWKEYKADMWGL